MAKIKVPNQVIPDSVHHIDEDNSEEYKHLLKETNHRIEAVRRKRS